MKGFILLPVLIIISLLGSLLLTLVFVATSSLQTGNRLLASSSAWRVQTNKDVMSLYSGSGDYALQADPTKMWGINKAKIPNLHEIFSANETCSILSGSLAPTPVLRPFETRDTCRNPSFAAGQRLVVLNSLMLTIPKLLKDSPSLIASTGGVQITQLVLQSSPTTILAMGDIRLGKVVTDSCLTVISLQGSVTILQSSGSGAFDLQWKKDKVTPTGIVLGSCASQIAEIPAYVFGLARNIS